MLPVDQLDLLPRPKPQEHVSDEVIRKLPNMSAAINLSILAAGMEPKEAYMSLDIDKGVWSRIMMGQANFPHEKYTTLEDVTGNDIPVRWLCIRRNKEVKPMKSALEEMLEAEKAKNVELTKENEFFRSLFREMRK